MAWPSNRPAEKAIEMDVDKLADEQGAPRSVQMLKTMTVPKRMKLLSESNLDEVLPWHWKMGEQYHVMSFGDVDSLTFLRHAVRQRPFDYCLISTWCMAKADALEVAGWVERGFIKRIDFYVGEIFKDGYRGCRDELDKIARSCGGRVARFRNHSKVMVGISDDLSFSIESSANVDTNPRCESTCITCDRDLAVWHKEFYDGINSFERDYDGWQPMKLT